MAEKKKNSKMGRPKLKIDWEKVNKLCEIMCTNEEIAFVVGVDADTLCNHTKREYGITFSDYIKKHQALGKASLRRNQFRLSETNAAMCIWLGKQYLGQKDRDEGDEGEQNLTIQIN